jgi:hypothetical protein
MRRDLRSLIVLLCVGLCFVLQGCTDLRQVDVHQLAQLPTDDPGAAVARAHAWQQRGLTVPDPVLRNVVTAAFRQDAPWATVEAAIRAFDLYHNRPWASAAMAPFLTRHAGAVLVNARWFAGLQREWTKWVIAHTALQSPSLLLGEITQLVALDPAWAKALAETAVLSAPALAFAHTRAFLTVDRLWTQRLLHTAAQKFPHAAIREVPTYIAEPWGPQLFAAAVLRVPHWVVGVAAVADPTGQVVLQALRQATSPPLRVLAYLATSSYPHETKKRMAAFVYDLVDGQRSFDEVASLCQDIYTYFRTLHRMKRLQPEKALLDMALTTQTLELIEPINQQYDQPEAIRFRAVERLAAQDLYVLLTYADTEMFTSSYRGLFTRLLARMAREKLTGDQLLEEMAYLRFGVFMKLAAAFNRLDQFLVTVPSEAVRGALLTRLITARQDPTARDMEHAMTVVEVLAARLDDHSLRAMRDVILREYQRAEREKNRHALVVYGLFAVQWDRRATPDVRTPALSAIAARYQASLPDLKQLAAASLFRDGRHVQRHFFYDDEDGKQSFASFLAYYRHDRAWQIDDHKGYIRITAQMAGRTMEIYANKPTTEVTDHKDVMLPLFLQHQPDVIVHRGHSLYVDATIAHIPATAALVFLGNCGSSRQLGAALARAPRAQLITTKGIGSLTINDPLLKALNTALLRGEDMVWADFWAHMASTLGRNPRFEDYLPPDKNVGVLFLRAYRTVTTDRVAGDRGV